MRAVNRLSCRSVSPRVLLHHRRGSERSDSFHRSGVLTARDASGRPVLVSALTHGRVFPTLVPFRLREVASQREPRIFDPLHTRNGRRLLRGRFPAPGPSLPTTNSSSVTGDERLHETLQLAKLLLPRPYKWFEASSLRAGESRRAPLRRRTSRHFRFINTNAHGTAVCVSRRKRHVTSGKVVQSQPWRGCELNGGESRSGRRQTEGGTSLAQHVLSTGGASWSLCGGLRYLHHT